VVAYCSPTDLLIGDIPVSGELNPAKYVQDAADEIDSKIGFLYTTPIPVDASSGTARPVVLLLKRINVHLASGRLILAATIPAENERLNAYGRSLVREAEDAIEAIASGQIILDGVLAGGFALPRKAVPLISNGDLESSVDAFYDRVVNPNYQFQSPYRPYRADY